MFKMDGTKGNGRPELAMIAPSMIQMHRFLDSLFITKMKLDEQQGGIFKPAVMTEEDIKRFGPTPKFSFVTRYSADITPSFKLVVYELFHTILDVSDVSDLFTLP
jgi:hypothetical protein